jgi:transcriptional regulator with XRE-family HTH domain
MQAEDNKLLEEIGELLAIHYEDWQMQEHSGPEVAFGRYLRSVRRVQELTIAQVATRTKLPESEILAYERGLIPQRLIKVVSLKALAETLDEEIDTFLLLLEANLVGETGPKPSKGVDGGRAESQRSQGNYGHRLFPGYGHPDHNESTGAVAVLERDGQLGSSITKVHAVEPATPLPIGTVVTPPKRTLRQVVADPIWQNKIYRVWAPVATLLLFFCLQVPTFHPDWMAGYHFSFSPFVQAPKINSDQSLGNPLIAAQMHQRSVQSSTMAYKMAMTDSLPLRPFSTELAQTFSKQIWWPLIQPNSFDEVFTAKFQAASISIPKQPSALPSNLQIANTPIQVVHMIGAGEGMACIANQYYQNETFYPLLCLYNFGSTQCTQSLQIGHLVTIPVFEDFNQDDPQVRQALAQLPAGVINRFKAISRDNVNTNYAERLRGIDYFCQNDDYQNYGEPLVKAGKVDLARVQLKTTAQEQYAQKLDEALSQTNNGPVANNG